MCTEPLPQYLVSGAKWTSPSMRTARFTGSVRIVIIALGTSTYWAVHDTGSADATIVRVESTDPSDHVENAHAWVAP